MYTHACGSMWACVCMWAHTCTHESVDALLVAMHGLPHRCTPVCPLLQHCISPRSPSVLARGCVCPGLDIEAPRIAAAPTVGARVLQSCLPGCEPTGDTYVMAQRVQHDQPCLLSSSQGHALHGTAPCPPAAPAAMQTLRETKTLNKIWRNIDSNNESPHGPRWHETLAARYAEVGRRPCHACRG